MREHLGHHDDGKRFGGDEHLLERAVGVVGREHARQRQQRRQKSGHPDDARRDGAKNVAFGADAQRNERHHDGEKEDDLREVGLASQRQHQVAAQDDHEELQHRVLLQA